MPVLDWFVRRVMLDVIGRNTLCEHPFRMMWSLLQGSGIPCLCGYAQSILSAVNTLNLLVAFPVCSCSQCLLRSMAKLISHCLDAQKVGCVYTQKYKKESCLRIFSLDSRWFYA